MDVAQFLDYGLTGVVALSLLVGVRFMVYLVKQLTNIIHEQRVIIANHIDHSSRAETKLAASIDVLASWIQRIHEKETGGGGGG